MRSGATVHALGSGGGKSGSGEKLPEVWLVDEAVKPVSRARKMSRPYEATGAAPPFGRMFVAAAK